MSPKAKDDRIVTTHNGVAIKLDSDGTFYTEKPGWTPGDLLVDLTADSMTAIKKKLDARARQVAREKAASLPCVVLSLRQWHHDDERGDWYEGKFVGINAQTGEATIALSKATPGNQYRTARKAGEIVKIDSPIFFRAGDPAIQRTKDLLSARADAYQAYERAKDVLDNALDTHAFAIDVPHRDKAQAISRQEEELVAYLERPLDGK